MSQKADVQAERRVSAFCDILEKAAEQNKFPCTDSMSIGLIFRGRAVTDKTAMAAASVSFFQSPQ